MNFSKRILTTFLSIFIGLFVSNGFLFVCVEIAGPFYPDSDQQQRNFDYFIIGNFIIILVSGFFGNIIFNKHKQRVSEDMLPNATKH
jgi:hypothetical protein